ncbi:uncharacterized protein A4U43_C01F6450 [Asparagus officinalis]|uniref:LOB domain-containing protein n=1 Tax=Asparagus officinalis TaxID=4686 RepID=A0A5P1FMB3_ASPOF|nr:LOB domain-containing protein 24-like [Asparagus officinalis]ONK79446.1 uncharacterized protein A4U43_C01F6450 [Asparagus officinalis]
MSASNSSYNISKESNLRRCAACKYLRRRCSQDCVLSPYFPPSNPQRFACVHRIFGASNVTRMLQQLPAHLRAQAADAISSEAYWRVNDPVYGSVGIIARLHEDIYMHQHELALTRAQIAMHAAQHQYQVNSDHPPEIQTQTQQLDSLALQTQTQIQTQQLDSLAIQTQHRYQVTSGHPPKIQTQTQQLDSLVLQTQESNPDSAVGFTCYSDSDPDPFPAIGFTC